MYETVTDFPILIPCDEKEQDGWATFLGIVGPKGGFQPVRAFTDADLTPKSRKHPLRSMSDPERQLFTAIVGLSRGLEKKDRLAVKHARKMLIEAVARKNNIVPDADLLKAVSAMRGLNRDEIELAALELSTLTVGEEDEPRLLSSRVTAALASVRLVLWWSGSRFHPALYCPDGQSALYTYLLMRTSARQGCGVCPYCGIFFLKSRPDQSYCSVAHREAHRVARWRAAKVRKSKASKKGRKNVTRKTR